MCVVCYITSKSSTGSRHFLPRRIYGGHKEVPPKSKKVRDDKGCVTSQNVPSAVMPPTRSTIELLMFGLFLCRQKKALIVRNPVWHLWWSVAVYSVFHLGKFHLEGVLSVHRTGSILNMAEYVSTHLPWGTLPWIIQ